MNQFQTQDFLRFQVIFLKWWPAAAWTVPRPEPTISHNLHHRPSPSKWRHWRTSRIFSCYGM